MILFLYLTYYERAKNKILIEKAVWTGAKGGYLKCSIRGTNNELGNIFYKFVHLQLFRVKYKFVHLQLFDVKFLFSEKHLIRKKKRTTVYGRTSVVLDFKLTRENDDLLSLRHK